MPTEAQLARAALRRWIAARLEELEQEGDELYVVDSVVTRLCLGRARYGVLDVDDGRDWPQQAAEERADTIVYDAVELVRTLRRRREAITVQDRELSPDEAAALTAPRRTLTTAARAAVAETVDAAVARFHERNAAHLASVGYVYDRHADERAAVDAASARLDDVKRQIATLLDPDAHPHIVHVAPGPDAIAAAAEIQRSEELARDCQHEYTQCEPPSEELDRCAKCGDYKFNRTVEAVVIGPLELAPTVISKDDLDAAEIRRRCDCAECVRQRPAAMAELMERELAHAEERARADEQRLADAARGGPFFRGRDDTPTLADAPPFDIGGEGGES